MGATYVGVRRAHPFLWSLSSPQQPLETEDSPTVSLAPQYTSQRLCRAIDSKVFTHSLNLSLELSHRALFRPCLLYTSDAADERSSVDLGGRRIIKKKKLTTDLI